MSNSVLERINQVLQNLIRTFHISRQTYVEKYDPWTGILAVAEFVICSKTNRKKGYSPDQLIFGCEIIIPIKHRMASGLIIHQKQTQINRDNTR